MNIIEAVKSGKLFKRKEGNLWFRELNETMAEISYHVFVTSVNALSELHEEHNLFIEDLLANDWEVKDETD